MVPSRVNWSYSSSHVRYTLYHSPPISIGIHVSKILNHCLDVFTVDVCMYNEDLSNVAEPSLLWSTWSSHAWLDKSVQTFSGRRSYIKKW